MLLIPENIDDRVLSVCKTRIPTEYKENSIRIEYFKCINVFN